MSGSGPKRERCDRVRTLQLPTMHSEIRGLKEFQPSLFQPYRVLGVRAPTADLNRPWKAEPPEWLSLLGTSQCDA
ncbi:hypothetical protein MTO96_011235 [Rhipicephalus appendiculatus]